VSLFYFSRYRGDWSRLGCVEVDRLNFIAFLGVFCYAILHQSNPLSRAYAWSDLLISTSYYNIMIRILFQQRILAAIDT
jgi:hypothetical protein